MKTVADYVSYVNEVVPNNVATTSKYTFLQDILKDIRDLNTYYETRDTNTSTSASYYNFPTTDMLWSDIQWLGISNSTYNVAISPSTMPYSDYTEIKYKGLDEEIDSYQWVETGTSGIILYGLSTENKHWLRYKCLPTLIFGLSSGIGSSDSTTVIQVDSLLADYIQNKLAAKVCRSGAFPRIDLGNNYEMEAQDLLARAKLNKRIADTKRAKFKVGYKDWW
jgi:hypothetical protein